MRVKDNDCDVPMLTIDDFEFKQFPPEVLSMLDDCEFLYNTEHQRHLAMMFIEKSKLCLSVSQVLSAQYSVLSHRFGGTTETTMMLVPKKSNSETFEVRHCDGDLENWQANLPDEVRFKPLVGVDSLSPAESSLHLHRALLRMIYLTTSSALHRPQVLPATPFPTVEAELQEVSRNKVRCAAVEITNIAQGLHKLDLTRYLPTAGVTVLLPAVIIHLLDIKSNDLSIRMVSLQRFYQCMRILQRLREIYASADFATSFLEAAIRKAGIQLNISGMEGKAGAPPGTVRPAALTPPPDSQTAGSTYSQTPVGFRIPEIDTAMSLSAATPPHSNGSDNGSTQNFNPNIFNDAFEQPDLSLSDFIGLANDAEVTQNDFDALLNFDETSNDMFTGDDGLNLDVMGTEGQDKGGMGMDVNLANEFTSDSHILGYEINRRGDGLSLDVESDLGFALRL
jgi:hypothetical protein